MYIYTYTDIEYIIYNIIHLKYDFYIYTYYLSF